MPPIAITPSSPHRTPLSAFFRSVTPHRTRCRAKSTSARSTAKAWTPRASRWPPPLFYPLVPLPFGRAALPYYPLTRHPALARRIHAQVRWEDFERAVTEANPAFGNKSNDEIQSYFRNGICPYGPSFDDFWTTLKRLMKQTETSARTPLMSVLLEGAVSTGKVRVSSGCGGHMEKDLIEALVVLHTLRHYLT